MDRLTLLTASALTLLGPGAAAAAAAGLTGNVGVASNYLWRGETQTGDEAAVSGGLDYSHPAGLYLGTWTSNIGGQGDQDYEVDLYAGYATVFGNDVGIDIGLIGYYYPRGAGIDTAGNRIAANNEDFAEAYLGASYGRLGARYYYAEDYLNSGEAAYYAEVGFSYPLKRELSLGLHYGYKDGDAFSGGGYGDYSVSLSKGGFTALASDLTDNARAGQSDNPRVVVSWTHQLEL